MRKVGRETHGTQKKGEGGKGPVCLYNSGRRKRGKREREMMQGEVTNTCRRGGWPV